MGNPNDGGPAFPVDPHGSAEPGMTLRDYFAAKALSGLLADPNVNSAPPKLAEVAYNYADAMLAARAKAEEVAR